MPHWKSEIRRRLSAARIEPAREAEIVEELAQHLEDRYQEFRADGADDTAAHRMALQELKDAQQMIGELRETECRENKDPVRPGVPGNANFWRASFGISDTASEASERVRGSRSPWR